MIGFENACKIARNALMTKGYQDGFCEICDIGSNWLFFEKIFKNEAVEYGNCPVVVDKENGQCKDFPISKIENYDLYYASKNIEIPSEFVVKD